MDYAKLNRRIDHMFEYETTDDFIDININKEVENILYDFQIMHLFSLIVAIKSNKIILDGSDPGTGKTYLGVALCKQLGLSPVIICPLSLIANWKNICKLFNVKPLFIINYEAIKAGSYHDSDGNNIRCPYISIVGNDNFSTITWKLPRNCLLIFDEVHKCKNPKSQNGKLLLSTKSINTKVLMLSGTLTDNLKDFCIFGYMLGLYKELKNGKAWISAMVREDRLKIIKNDELSGINKAIYPTKGSRMRIKELGDKFPANQVSADSYHIDNKSKDLVNSAFKIITNSENIKRVDNSDKFILPEIIKARQLIENIKIPIFVELAKSYTEEGYNVVIFVNFTETINKLSKLLNTNCIVNGKTTVEDRLTNIENFQMNKEKIILVNMSIVEGMNLQDLHGVPRVSLLGLPFSSTLLIQALGRIHRAGSLSPALQRIIFCDGTCEEIICNKIKSKLNFLASLNDNDLVNIEMN
jgi:superfamily II DNA or RNA helicase